MKKVGFSLLFCVVAAGCGGGGVSSPPTDVVIPPPSPTPPPPPPPPPADVPPTPPNTIVISAAAERSPNLFPVHQGIAIEPQWVFTSHTNRLDRRRRGGWNIELSNQTPFSGLAPGLNHLGDIAAHDGIVYAVAEQYSYSDETSSAQTIVKYDSTTLRHLQSFDVSPLFGTRAMGSVAVHPASQSLFVPVYTSAGLGIINRIRATDGAPLGQIVPQFNAHFMRVQGIAIRDDTIYLACNVIGQPNKKRLVVLDFTGQMLAIFSLDLVVLPSHLEGIEFDTDGSLLILGDDALKESYVYRVWLPDHRPST